MKAISYTECHKVLSDTCGNVHVGDMLILDGEGLLLEHPNYIEDIIESKPAHIVVTLVSDEEYIFTKIGANTTMTIPKKDVDTHLYRVSDWLEFEYHLTKILKDGNKDRITILPNLVIEAISE